MKENKEPWIYIVAIDKRPPQNTTLLSTEELIALMGTFRGLCIYQTSPPDYQHNISETHGNWLRSIAKLLKIRAEYYNLTRYLPANIASSSGSSYASSCVVFVQPNGLSWLRQATVS